jgi:hypothetical protein
VKQNTVTLLEIRGAPDANRCTLYLRTEKVDASFPSNIPADIARLQKEALAKAEGRDGTCNFETTNLVPMLKRWNAGQLSTRDWNGADCHGPFFQASQ